MKSNYARLILVFLLCLNFNSFKAYSQKLHLVEKMPLDQQIELSSQIVEGKVISKESFWDDTHSNIYTKQIIEVYKVFKGQTLETLEIITSGGIVDLEAEVVSHSLQLQKGDIGLFLMESIGSEYAAKGIASTKFKAVSDDQGFYKYNLRKNEVVNPFEKIKDIKANFYSKIENHTKQKYTEVSLLEDVQNATTYKSTSTASKSTMPSLSISSFSSNTISAGTKSIITINGSGFGSTKGTVGFSDANFGGSIYYNALTNQIISWTDTQIQVEVPDRAGTGTIEVTTSNTQSVISSENLTVDFAQINLEYGNDAYQTQHVASNGNGGITWTMNQSFYNSGANAAFTRAFDNWVCNSGINWEISTSTTNITTSANDGVNVITFDSSLSSGVLGRCTSRYQGCFEGSAIKWYVSEMDIVFNPNKTWNYTTNPPTNTELDFETVTVHELGHGHQLGHVIDTNEVMHYSVSAGESVREPSAEDLNGALDVQARSTSTPVCSQLTMTDSSCFVQANLSADEFSLENQIIVYPNPAKDMLHLETNPTILASNLSLYNMLGKKVLERNIKTNRHESLDISSLSQGIYVLSIKTDKGNYSQKLVITR